MPPIAGPFVLLFPDELEAVRLRFVAALASADGSDYVPISDEKMRALGDRVKKGTLTDSGPVCARPPTFAEVVDAETKGGSDDSLAVASLMLDCDAKEDDCILQVSIGGLEGEREAELMLTTKVAPSSPRSNVEPWLAAVGDLMQVDELVGNGYGFGTGKGSELVRVALRETAGDFGSGFAQNPATPPASALASCHDGSPTRSDDVEHDTLLDVDAAGHVSKCAFAEIDHDAKREACVCAAFQKTKFPSSSSSSGATKIDRRALYAVVDTAPPHKHPKGTGVVSRVNVLEGQGHPEAPLALDIRALGDCYMATNPKDDITFDMHLAVDPAGHITKADIGAVPPSMKTCLSRAYLATPLVCDMEGQARTLHVGVTLSLQPQGAPQNKLAQNKAATLDK